MLNQRDKVTTISAPNGGNGIKDHTGPHLCQP